MESASLTDGRTELQAALPVNAAPMLDAMASWTSANYDVASALAGQGYGPVCWRGDVRDLRHYYFCAGGVRSVENA